MKKKKKIKLIDFLKGKILITISIYTIKKKKKSPL